MRIDGAADRARARAPSGVGAVLAFAQGGRVRVLRVEALPRRRGPPAEAASLYTALGKPTAQRPLTRPSARA